MKLVLSLLLVLIASPLLASNVTLAWDPVSGATGYRVYMSADQGATWANQDAANSTTYTWPNVSDTTLVLFKVSAYNSNGTSIADWRGAWWDGRRIPPGGQPQPAIK